jgi:hypothetical protein
MRIDLIQVKSEREAIAPSRMWSSPGNGEGRVFEKQNLQR